jgi:hypothetical protein
MVLCNELYFILKGQNNFHEFCSMNTFVEFENYVGKQNYLFICKLKLNCL